MARHVPPQLKNLFVFASNREFAHKPGLIVAVSSGMGGAYPVAELRMSSYKNTRIVWLPDHVIIRKVESFGDGSVDDVRLHDRLRKSVQILAEYAVRMTDLRDSVGDLLKLGSGM